MVKTLAPVTGAVAPVVTPVVKTLAPVTGALTPVVTTVTKTAGARSPGHWLRS